MRRFAPHAGDRRPVLDGGGRDAWPGIWRRRREDGPCHPAGPRERRSRHLRPAQGHGGPFGAAVFEIPSGRLVAAGVNSVTRLQNCVLHAEVVALMLAQQRVRSFTLGPPALPAHELFTSCEPCAMCLGVTLYSG